MPSNSVVSVSEYPCSSPSPSPSPTASTSSNNWSPPSTLISSKRLKNNGHPVSCILEDQQSQCSQKSPDLDADNTGALYWNASLLYYGGYAISPKIKTQNLRSTVSMSDMHRPLSPATRKILTKSPSNDSGTGTYSAMSNGEEQMSPLRRRHLSCGSSSTASSSSMGSLKGKMKSPSTTTSSGSMRLMKAISRRPSLSSFMEKTQSLGRYSRNKSASPISGDNDTIDETTSTVTTTATASPPESSSSSSGLTSATAKVFRDSFRAAKNLLPSSSKLTNSTKASIKKAVSSTSLASSSTSAKSHSKAISSSTSTINYSAPNSPKKVTERKSFASSLSNFRKRKGSSSGAKDQTLIPESVTQSKDNSITIEDKTGSLDSPITTTTTSISTEKDSEGSSKSISSKLKKSKDKASSGSSNDKKDTKDTQVTSSQEKVPTKKVSLVKSLTRKLQNRSKDKKQDKESGGSTSGNKDLPLSESTGSKSKSKSKSVSERNKNSSSPEILQLDNEPRVRAPKTLRQRSSVTSTPEKDREYSEMEVSEEALEISREEKLSQETNVTNKSQKKSKEQKKSQTSPSVISKEEKGASNNSGNNKVEKTNKGSNKETKSSSSSVSPTQTESSVTNNTSAFTGESTNLTSLSEEKVTKSNEMPSSSKNTKKGKFKAGKKKKSVDTSETKSSAQETLLDTKVDAEVDDASDPGGNGEIKGDPGDLNNQIKPTSAAASSSSDTTREDQPSTLASSDVTDAKNNEQLENSSEESSNINPKERYARQDINVSVTTAQADKDFNSPEQVTTGKTMSISNDPDTREMVEADGDDDESECTDSFRQLKPFNFNSDPMLEGKRERLYKVLVVGELGAGKTSIIKRYVHQFFSQHYRATIGVDFALKVLRWDPDTVVRLQLWDIAGQERFGSMTRVYYKEAVGAFVVFDVTRAATLEAVPKWKADLDSKVALPDGRPIPTVLLANKSDQPKEGIAANREKMNDFCQQQGFSAWFETSAKDNINIDESANFLVSKILEMDRWSQEPLSPDPDKVDLSANGKHKSSADSNCAC